MMKTKFFFILYTIVTVIAGSQSFAQWAQTNGPGGGMILSLRVKDSVVYAGTYRGKVYRSTNYGMSWSAMNIGSVSAQTIVFSDSTIYIGTSEDGILSSSDNFTTMKQSFPGTDVFGSVLALSVRDTTLLAGTDVGLFRSTDNGDSWVTADTSLPADGFAAVARNDTEIYFGTTGWGIYRSTDEGLSWTPVTSGLTSYNIRALAIVDTEIFAGTRNGVFISRNHGLSWSATNSGLSNLRVTTLSATPNQIEGTTLFAGTTSGVFRSTNDGALWERVSSGLYDSNIVATAIVYGTGNQMNVFVGTTNSGVFRSTNEGQSWKPMNDGLVQTRATALTIGNAQIFAGSTIGVFSSTDGTNWTLGTDGMTYTGIYTLCLAPDDSGRQTVFAGTTARGVFRSSDNGFTWVASGLSDKSILSLASTPAGTGKPIVFVGTAISGLYRSTDNGMSWTISDSGLPAFAIESILMKDNGIGGVTIFVGTGGFGVYVSTDSGASWTQHTRPELSEVYTFAVSGNTIYAGTPISGVFTSTDDGANWTAASTGLTNQRIAALAVSGTTVFAGTIGGGVFVSTNNGTNWTEANTNLGTLDVRGLAVRETDLYAGTYGGGVWRRPVSEMITAVQDGDNLQTPTNYSLQQNYPNPFNPTTTIGYELARASHVVLVVYNVLGQRVATLVNEEQVAGAYTVAFDATNLANGVFFYRIIAGNFVNTKKLVLLR